jgi:hypothetical protein
MSTLRLGIVTFLTLLLSLNLPLWATTEAENPAHSASSSLSEDTNVHFTGKYCDECHEKTPKKGEETYLKYGGDYNQLCKCHGYTPGTYIHPVDVVPSEEKKSRIPEEFPLPDGKIACITCHNIYEQCQEDSSSDKGNKRGRLYFKSQSMFLRGDKNQKRTDLCFKCHNEEKYKMLDPHNQISSEGEIVTEKCLYCHTKKPDPDKQDLANIKLIGELKTLCQRCHGLMQRHPAGVDHYKRPSIKFYRRMKELEDQYGIILPLDFEGKLTCVTCHNPHEKGVIPFYKQASKGADEAYRHRLPGKLCKSCHGF